MGKAGLGNGSDLACTSFLALKKQTVLRNKSLPEKPKYHLTPTRIAIK